MLFVYVIVMIVGGNVPASLQLNYSLLSVFLGGFATVTSPALVIQATLEPESPETSKERLQKNQDKTLLPCHS